MNNVGHFLIFDLSKLGSAYQIINEFVDGTTVTVFEISPVADRAVLILVCSDIISAQVIMQQTRSVFQSDILESALVENFSADVVQIFLSQKQAPVKKNIMVAEYNFFSSALSAANKMVRSGLGLVDLRSIRTNPANVVLVFSDDSTVAMQEFSTSAKQGRFTIITDVKSSLKSYFEFVK